MVSSYPRLCDNLVHRRQKLVLGPSIPGSIPERFLYFGPDRLWEAE